MRSILLNSLLLIAYGTYCAYASGPQVNLTTGVFEGVSSSKNGTDRWLGIPYALPPTDSLRFKAPQPIAGFSEGIQNASSFGNACSQPLTSELGTVNLGAPVSEDCLFLNVWRPENTSLDAGLPVLVWIYGGSYNTGTASDPTYDGTGIVNRSVATGRPIIFVSMQVSVQNYRLNTFGFLASADMPVEDLNAGIQDQRMALQFIQDNISHFGGNPSKVTIWGQSAGAGSVESHILYGDPSLFRGAIMNSATGPFKTAPPPSSYDQPGKPYDLLLNATFCETGSSSVECLQQVPFGTLMNITNTLMSDVLNGQLWEPTVAAGNFISVEPSEKISAGDFLHIPVIMGTNLNDGSLFSIAVMNLGLSGSAQDAALDKFMLATLIDNSTVTSDVLLENNALYPANDTSLGAPFNTGDSLFDRASAWYGDAYFLAPRRLFVDQAADLQPVYAYSFQEQIPGNIEFLGVYHASELPLLFGPIPAVASVETEFAEIWQDFYLDFVYDLNPGDAWPQYTSESRQILQLKRDNITAIPDDFDSASSGFQNLPEVLLEWQK